MMDLLLTQCEEKWVAMAAEDVEDAMEEETAGEEVAAGMVLVDEEEDGGMEIEDDKMEGGISNGSWGRN